MYPAGMRRLLALVVLPLLCGAQEFAGRADQYVNYWFKAGKFMGSVLVARNGETLFRKSYGWANAEWDVPKSAGREVPAGVDHQAVYGRFHPATSRAGQAEAQRPDQPVPSQSAGVVGADHDRAPAQPHVGHSQLYGAAGVLRKAHLGAAHPDRNCEPVARSAAGVQTRREVRVQQHGLCAARLHRRQGHRRCGTRLFAGARPGPGRDEGHRLRLERRGDQEAGVGILGQRSRTCATRATST